MIPSYYFNPRALHKHRSKYFRADLEELYTNFVRDHSLKFTTFKIAWKAMRFATIHYAITPDENVREFYESLYGSVLSFVRVGFKFDKTKAESVVSQIEPTVFALYALYSLYNTQPLPQRVKININLEIWETFVEVYKCIEKALKGLEYPSILKKMRADDVFSFGVIVGLKTILLDNHGYILKRKKVNKIELPEELLTESAEDILKGLENRKPQQEALEKYFDKKTELAKDLRAANLEEHVRPEISKAEIADMVYHTVKENMKPIKKPQDQSEEETATLHKTQVDIAMEKLKARVFDYVENHPRWMLSVVDETHAEEIRVKLEKFMREAGMVEAEYDEDEGGIDNDDEVTP